MYCLQSIYHAKRNGGMERERKCLLGKKLKQGVEEKCIRVTEKRRKLHHKRGKLPLKTHPYRVISRVADVVGSGCFGQMQIPL